MPRHELGIELRSFLTVADSANLVSMLKCRCNYSLFQFFLWETGLVLISLH